MLCHPRLEKNGDIVMQHIPGIMNPSDDLAEPLGWVLHSQHTQRGMGHCRIGSLLDSAFSVQTPVPEQSPFHPAKTEPVLAIAVKVITESKR